MISPERLERYSDFVDPERTGVPYDPRQGLERLLGVLSPDPKGIVLAAMGEDWYGTKDQLKTRIYAWLEESGISSRIWPISRSASWIYCKNRYKGEIIDGSLVNLGAVVKKIEGPQTLYSRSLAGAELAVPLVQQAATFVSRARKYGSPHKFDSMWRIIGNVGSRTDQRRPVAVFDVIDFLVHHKGGHRQVDLQKETHISHGRLEYILTYLGNCGIINYTSPTVEREGLKGKGWSVTRLVDQRFLEHPDPDKIYQDIRGIRKDFYSPDHIVRAITYIKQHPNSEYESGDLARVLDIHPTNASRILSILVDLGILQRLEPGYKGGETMSKASANDLTYLFNDLVYAPVKNIADTLSPPPLKLWSKEELAIYLQNYDEERSREGLRGGDQVRSLLIDILSQHKGEDLKLSHIADLYNAQTVRELHSETLGHQLHFLLKLGEVTQPRRGYYQLTQR